MPVSRQTQEGRNGLSTFPTELLKELNPYAGAAIHRGWESTKMFLPRAMSKNPRSPRGREAGSGR